MLSRSSERVAVCVDASNRPISFRWRGRAFHIDAVERIWRQPVAVGNGQRLYRIRSRQRLFLLRYDRRLRSWSVVRSPWRMRWGMTLAGLIMRLAA